MTEFFRVEVHKLRGCAGSVGVKEALVYSGGRMRSSSDRGEVG